MGAGTAASRGGHARRLALAGLAALVAGLAAAPPAHAAPLVPDDFAVEVMAGSLDQPVGMAFLPDGRLVVIQQRDGRVLMLHGPAGSALDTLGVVPNVNASGNERGLLGVAVDPGWPARPYLYFHYTATGLHVNLSRFRVAGDVAGTGNDDLTLDTASRYDLVTDIPDNAFNHNGGTLRFGLDGTLYVSLGEDAQPCAAQDRVSLRGVILRLAVAGLPDGPGAATRAQITPADNPFVTASDPNERLVWALGLRNPFRFAVDPATAVLYIADVGEDVAEELDRADHAGMNFGWPYREGRTDHFSSCTGIDRPATLTEPIFAYTHAAEETGTGMAIVTAGAYRDRSLGRDGFPAGYDGNLFASDYYNGHLWRLAGSANAWSIASIVPGQSAGNYWGLGFDTVSDYALGPDGALWYCRQFGSLIGGGAGSIGRVYSTVANPNPRSPVRIAVLRPAYPTPARGDVKLEFALSAAVTVRVGIYDLRGRRVRDLMPSQALEAGSYPSLAMWNGLDDDGNLVDSGLYFGRLSAAGRDYEWRIVIAR